MLSQILCLVTAELLRVGNARRAREQLWDTLDLAVITEGHSAQIPGTIQDATEEADEALSGLQSLEPLKLSMRCELQEAVEKMDKFLRVAQKVEGQMVDCMPYVGSAGSQNSLTMESDKIAYTIGSKLQVSAERGGHPVHAAAMLGTPGCEEKTGPLDEKKHWVSLWKRLCVALVLWIVFSGG